MSRRRVTPSSTVYLTRRLTLTQALYADTLPPIMASATSDSTSLMSYSSLHQPGSPDSS